MIILSNQAVVIAVTTISGPHYTGEPAANRHETAVEELLHDSTHDIFSLR